MKVSWTLNDMDKIKNRHLKANLEYWKMDLLYNATRLIEKLDKSKFLKYMGKGSEQLKNMIFLASSRAKMAEDDINQMVDYMIRMDDDKTTLTLYVNPNYFSMNEMLQVKMGRRMAKYFAKKSVSRQELIDGFEGELRKTYTKDFVGKIVEDDGKTLSIYH